MYRKLIWVKREEFVWALKLFVKSIGLTLGLWLFLFVLSTWVFSDPEPLASATIDVVSLVMGRVGLLEEKVGLWMAIFALNTVVTVVASTASALLLLTLPFEVKDLKYRMAHPTYEKIAKIMDKVGITLLWNPLFHIFKRFNSSFAEIYRSEPPRNQFQGCWRFCGYSGTGFRNIYYIIPYLIPALIAIVNGIIIGMVLAVNIFLGAYDGFLIAGLRGLTVGVLLNFLYFLSVILPHGVIEVFAVLTAIAFGQGFASRYSNTILEQKLLMDHRLEELEKHVKYLVALTKQFLTSKTVLIPLTLVICLLCIASYIEVYITPNIAERVLTILRGIWVRSLASS